MVNKWSLSMFAIVPTKAMRESRWKVAKMAVYMFDKEQPTSKFYTISVVIRV